MEDLMLVVLREFDGFKGDYFEMLLSFLKATYNQLNNFNVKDDVGLYVSRLKKVI